MSQLTEFEANMTKAQIRKQSTAALQTLIPKWTASLGALRKVQSDSQQKMIIAQRGGNDADAQMWKTAYEDVKKTANAMQGRISYANEVIKSRRSARPAAPVASVEPVEEVAPEPSMSFDLMGALNNASTPVKAVLGVVAGAGLMVGVLRLIGE